LAIIYIFAPYIKRFAMKRLFLFFVFVTLLCSSSIAQPQEQFSDYGEMVAAAKKEVELISIDEFHTQYDNVLHDGDVHFVLIDVRTEAENNDGYIPGAFLIQRGTLESAIGRDAVWEELNHPKPKKSDIIILYCRSGSRSALAAKSLQQLGYTQVKSLEGGWNDWSEKYPNLIKEY
jgi:rhodanese-related sulfurtransferase